MKSTHKIPPVIRIAKGDSLVSESVDADGFDKTGTRVAESGNLLTGPIFIEGASSGDIIAITLTKVSLNCDYATQKLVFQELKTRNILLQWEWAKHWKTH